MNLSVRSAQKKRGRPYVVSELAHLHPTPQLPSQPQARCPHAGFHQLSPPVCMCMCVCKCDCLASHPTGGLPHDTTRYNGCGPKRPLPPLSISSNVQSSPPRSQTPGPDATAAAGTPAAAAVPPAAAVWRGRTGGSLGAARRGRWRRRVRGGGW